MAQSPLLQSSLINWPQRIVLHPSWGPCGPSSALAEPQASSSRCVAPLSLLMPWTAAIYEQRTGLSQCGSCLAGSQGWRPLTPCLGGSLPIRLLPALPLVDLLEHRTPCRLPPLLLKVLAVPAHPRTPAAPRGPLRHVVQVSLHPDHRLAQVCFARAWCETWMPVWLCRPLCWSRALLQHQRAPGDFLYAKEAPAQPARRGALARPAPRLVAPSPPHGPQPPSSPFLFFSEKKRGVPEPEQLMKTEKPSQ